MFASFIAKAKYNGFELESHIGYTQATTMEEHTAFIVKFVEDGFNNKPEKNIIECVKQNLLMIAETNGDEKVYRNIINGNAKKEILPSSEEAKHAMISSFLEGLCYLKHKGELGPDDFYELKPSYLGSVMDMREHPETRSQAKRQREEDEIRQREEDEIRSQAKRQREEDEIPIKTGKIPYYKPRSGSPNIYRKEKQASKKIKIKEPVKDGAGCIIDHVRRVVKK